MDRWIGKVAIITGAGDGIGAALAEKLVVKGLKVVGLDLSTEKMQEAAEKLSQETGKLYAVKTDITKEPDIKNAIKWTTQNVGPISILINNAGVSKPGGLINGSAENWKLLLETNVLGLCLITKEVIQNMKANNIDGHIVNLNSITGHVIPDIPLIGLYPATKYAVTAFSETLRKELFSEGSKIKVTSVSPGLVKTNLSKSLHGLGIPSLMPGDVAETIIMALSSPPHVLMCEIIVMHV